MTAAISHETLARVPFPTWASTFALFLSLYLSQALISERNDIFFLMRSSVPVWDSSTWNDRFWMKKREEDRPRFNFHVGLNFLFVAGSCNITASDRDVTRKNEKKRCAAILLRVTNTNVLLWILISYHKKKKNNSSYIIFELKRDDWRPTPITVQERLAQR